MIREENMIWIGKKKVQMEYMEPESFSVCLGKGITPLPGGGGGGGLLLLLMSCKGRVLGRSAGNSSSAIRDHTFSAKPPGVPGVNNKSLGSGFHVPPTSIATPSRGANRPATSPPRSSPTPVRARAWRRPLPRSRVQTPARPGWRTICPRTKTRPTW